MYHESHPDYGALSQYVEKAMFFIGSTLRYIDNIYLIDNQGIDNFTAMAYFIAAVEDYDHQTGCRSAHIVFSRSMIPLQIAHADQIVQLYNKRDKSYVITEASAYSNGILKDRKTKANEHFTPAMLPFVWMLGGCPDVGMKPTEFAANVTSAIKLLNPIIGKYITGKTSFSVSLDRLIEHLPQCDHLKDTRDELMHRYRALNLVISIYSLTRSQLIRLQQSIVDLYDQNALEEINNLLSQIGANEALLELENLNMSYNE